MHATSKANARSFPDVGCSSICRSITGSSSRLPSNRVSTGATRLWIVWLEAKKGSGDCERDGGEVSSSMSSWVILGVEESRRMAGTLGDEGGEGWVEEPLGMVRLAGRWVHVGKKEEVENRQRSACTRFSISSSAQQPTTPAPTNGTSESLYSHTLIKTPTMGSLTTSTGGKGWADR